MAGNARFHNKYHRANHHTNNTPGIPDSGSDPIASSLFPFQGDFVLNGSLSASGFKTGGSTGIDYVATINGVTYTWKKGILISAV